MGWETTDWITVGVGVAILAFLWNLHRDMADLRERMARIEGGMDILTKLLIEHKTARD